MGKSLAWIEEHVVRTRMQDKATGAMIRANGQRIVAATFRHDTSRHLEPQLRHLDRAWASTVHAFQGRTVDRIIAAMPADHPNLTTQQSFHVAISRARSPRGTGRRRAWKLADQLEKATVEHVAALDGVALQAAHETVFGGKVAAEREPDRARRAPEATERGHEAGPMGPSEDGRGPDLCVEPGRDRDGNLPERAAGRHQGDRDSCRSGHWRGRSHGPDREAATEKSMEPTPKSVGLDLSM